MKTNKIIFKAIAGLFYMLVCYAAPAQNVSYIANSIPLNGPAPGYFGNCGFGVGVLSSYSSGGGGADAALGYNAGAGQLTDQATQMGAFAQSLADVPNSVSIGYKAGYYDNAGWNVAVGAGALLYNTSSYNTSIGYATLGVNTTGTPNDAFGAWALSANTSGNYNVGMGYKSLFTNSSGANNTAVGFNSLYSNSTGSNNSALGYQALYNTTSGPNDAAGENALFSNVGGVDNVAIGATALYKNTNGNYNTAIGAQCMYYNTSGAYNTGFGFNALIDNTSGANNTAIGYEALLANTTASNNVAVGSQALSHSTGGSGLVAFGTQCLGNLSTGTYNTAMGYQALVTETNGTENVAYGNYALENETGGTGNTALGYNSGIAYSKYTDCTFLGELTDFSTGTTVANATAIGYKATATNNEVRLGNGNCLTVGGNVTFSIPSDGRFKTNITEDVKGLEFIKKLRPIVYTFQTDKLDEFLMHNLPDRIKQRRASGNNNEPGPVVRQSGFLAQEVAQAAKESGYDFNGVHVPADSNTDYYRISYGLFVVPLVKGMQQQKATLDNQKDVLADANAQMDVLMTEANYLKQNCNADKNDIDVSNIPAQLKNPLLFNAIPDAGTTAYISYFVPYTAKSARVDVKDKDGRFIQSFVATNPGYLSNTVDMASAGNSIAYTLIVDGQLVDTKTASLK